MWTIPAQVLVSDGVAWRSAVQVAAARDIPVLVVTLSLSVAVSLRREGVGVVIEPEPLTLATAIARLVQGESYGDPRIDATLTDLQLSPGERQVLPFVLREVSTEQIAETLALSESAVRKVRNRIMDRLLVQHLHELRELLDEHELQG